MVDGLKWKGDELGRRAREDPRMRRFPYLGYTIVLVPVDVMPFRGGAAMLIGTMYGFKPGDLIDLRSRQVAMGGEQPRTWWVFAIRNDVIDTRLRKTSAASKDDREPKSGKRKKKKHKR